MVEAFLQGNALRMDDMDYYAAVFALGGDEILAGGGLKGGVIKCVAVRPDCRSEALACRIVSHLVSVANADGFQCVKLFTKPQNEAAFASMSFRVLAEAPQAVLMETGVGGIGQYCRYLQGVRRKAEVRLAQGAGHSAAHDKGCSPAQEIGVVVMNANPFTLGHRWLIERAASMVRILYVVAVREEASLFSYDERIGMIRSGVAHVDNVEVCEGSDYAVSAATFPTYFLKRITDASDTQMLLDLDLFARHIMPALGATVRFVGSEPDDALTRRYNSLMKERLVSVVELPRFCMPSGVFGVPGEQQRPVSASIVRRSIGGGCFSRAAALVPVSTMPHVIAQLATQALQTELDTTPKPGLVDRHDNGSHTDMDYALMCRSIAALHPYFLRLAQMGFAAVLPSHAAVAEVGLQAERAMFAATGGVNAHKGALFSVGLMVVSAAHAVFVSGGTKPSADTLQQCVARLADSFPYASGTHGSAARHMAAAEGGAGAEIKGALDNAREGYRQLFGSWLPFYESRIRIADEYALHRTLLRIMCDLDDTNIIFRTSWAEAQGVKAEARQLLGRFSESALAAMNDSFVRRNISPGGSADMLSLTAFVSAMCR